MRWSGPPRGAGARSWDTTGSLVRWGGFPPSPRLRASDIMEPNLTYVYPHTRIQSLVSILRTTVHHAFPVVTENRGNEKEFMKGNQLISNNIKFKVQHPRRRWVRNKPLFGARADLAPATPHRWGHWWTLRENPLLCSVRQGV